MERKSSTYSVVRTNIQVFGVASFLLLLTAAAEGLHVVPSVENVAAEIGQRVELYCRREVNSNANEISWFKNGLIWFRLGFKENCNVMFNESYATLVIPSVEKNDAGLYQCASQSTNLTVFNISQASSTESSDSKHDLLQKILDYVSANHAFLIMILITLLIGAGTIVAFYVFPNWWKGKSAGQRERSIEPLIDEFKRSVDPLIDEFKRSVDPLIDEFKRSVDPLKDEFKRSVDELHTVREEMATTVVEWKDNMRNRDEAPGSRLAEELKNLKELCKKQSEDLGFLVSKVDNLEKDVSTYHGIVVHELRMLSIATKRRETLQQSLPSDSDKHGFSVTDADAYIDASSND